MSIEISTDAALRGTAALRELVEAIVGADEHDEADWVEWKGQLNLATKEGCHHVARAILGLANREPERAQTTCGGLGYIVVGAEPGTLHGLTTNDPAKLDQVIQPYLGGAGGPAWTPTYIAVDGKNVLVVTVEAPKEGDKIYSLRRTFNNYQDGAIFIRKHGRTVLADGADIDALQRRLIATPIGRGAKVAVSIVGEVPLSWFDSAAVKDEVEAWADAERQQLIDEAREIDRRRKASKTSFLNIDPSGFLGIAASLAQQQARMAEIARVSPFTMIEDQRTLAEYEEEVARWHQKLIATVGEELLERYFDAGHGIIAVEIENLGGRFLPEVEVEVYFEDEFVKGLEDKPGGIDYPAEPHPFGKPRHHPSGLAGILEATSSLTYQAPMMPSLHANRRRTWIEDGSLKVRWNVGNLRQRGRGRSDEFYVLLSRRPAAGALHGTWRATVRDIDGVLTGTVDLPLAEEPLDIRSLLSLPGPG